MVKLCTLPLGGDHADCPRTIVALLVVIAAGLPGRAAGAAAEPSRVGGPDRVRVIVELTGRDHADAVVTGLGGQARELRRTERLPFLVLEVARPALAGLPRSPHVVAVQECVAVPPALASTLPVINADDVHGLAPRGGSATVAVLDTEIDDDHPAFAGRLVAERCFSTDNGGPQRTLRPDGTDLDVERPSLPSRAPSRPRRAPTPTPTPTPASPPSATALAR